MIDDQRFYMVQNDLETCRPVRIEFTAGEAKPRWMPLSPAALFAGVQDKARDSADRTFCLATLALTTGEAHQRRAQERITTRGTRNIVLRPRTVADYIEEAIDPKGARAKREKRKQDPGRINMEHLRISQLIASLLPPIKSELGFPIENPSQLTYSITEGAIGAAKNEACKSYLRRIKVGRLLTQHMYEKLKSHLRSEFPNDLEPVTEEIDRSASRDHLAAVSLRSQGSQLMVSIVNVRGDMVTLEDWKLLKLVEAREEFLTLGTLDARGGWLPEPLLKFNANKVGEIIAIYTVRDSTLHVVCNRELASPRGKPTQETYDRAEFVIDQDYLTCLYIMITQLRADRQRFETLRENAEATTKVTMNDLFDKELFD
ncbi:hypothetical protein [Geomonas propionica]|uniref:Uncharacterized protein n=1 Tax=Geomonas propionica TaxID=2798582 RepID=A0ABS0YQK0_9BACT|nr:hypothetical protein [Geomonas propionica]MBJ6799732.1 hypothetical protein [Geomonas propionica]